MDTTTCFTTSNANSYLYDSENQYIVNIHPVIKQIAWMDKNGLLEKNEQRKHLSEKFPQLTESDLSFYLRKYFFLKENQFFQENSIQELLSARLTPKTVEDQLPNVDHLLFQVTADCNLQCRYCCYGELYENPEPHRTGSLSFEQAKKVVDYLVPYWNSNRNISYQNKIIIGFYGGEPLVNFSLIKQIVEYVQTIRLKNQATFTFNMTTNSLLLDRYMDFLVEHDFSLLFSLDGNEIHDYLRVDKNNKPTFKRVFANIKKFQQIYPGFFKQNVQFNSLLNNQSNLEDIFSFIKQEFDKTPMIGSLSTHGLRTDKMDDFKKIFKSYQESEELGEKLGSRSIRNKNAGYFFYYHLQNAYRQYYEILMRNKKPEKKIPTGTCLPFWKKMFISSSGEIYACERIGLEHILGYVKEEVKLDFEGIANLYNRYFDFIQKQCNECYQADFCSECLFQFHFKNGNPVCNNWQSASEHEKYLAKIIESLENNPASFDDINKMTFA